MNTFLLGKYGEEYVRLALSKYYQITKPVPSDINIQMVWGDLVVPSCIEVGIPVIKKEVKTEIDDPNGNFFMELWSNKSIGREGWLKTSQADVLYYLYWAAGYGFRFSSWQHSAWMIDYNSSKYRLIEQKKASQANDTWGYLVPHDSLEGLFAPRKFQLCENLKQQAEMSVASAGSPTA